MTFSPDYEYWKTFDTLSIGDVASLMKVIEPRALGDIVVNGQGDGVDLSHEEAQIISALQAGLLRSFPASSAPVNGHTKILKQELLPWLRSRGFVDLADRISGPTQAPPATGKLADAERRLKALRDLGGTVKPNKKLGFGWKFTGISKLVAQEKAAGYPRCDEKTVRADLIEAADAEKSARSLRGRRFQGAMKWAICGFCSARGVTGHEFGAVRPRFRIFEPYRALGASAFCPAVALSRFALNTSGAD